MLVKNGFFQWVRIAKFLRYTWRFRKSILSNWSFSLVELDERIYRQLSIYLWTFRKRHEFNEQIKKEWL